MPKKENRGGARAGAGRKKKEPREYDEHFKTTLLEALERKAEETGKDFGDIFADTLYDRKTQDSVKSGLLKTLGEIMTIRESKKTVETMDKGPVILLPGVQPKPEEIKKKEAEFNRN